MAARQASCHRPCTRPIIGSPIIPNKNIENLCIGRRRHLAPTMGVDLFIEDFCNWQSVASGPDDESSTTWDSTAPILSVVKPIGSIRRPNSFRTIATNEVFVVHVFGGTDNCHDMVPNASRGVPVAISTTNDNNNDHRNRFVVMLGKSSLA